ncbi:hypothetical protein AwWohl_05620 [Gammaproteobacteria bacterium]|nr:hypothetical protein AwWohl_05620 [Gammaproteobacteria bacterium]
MINKEGLFYKFDNDEHFQIFLEHDEIDDADDSLSIILLNQNILAVQTASSQVNTTYDLYKINASPNKIEKIDITLTNPIITTDGELLSIYKDYAKWWLDAYCQDPMLLLKQCGIGIELPSENKDGIFIGKINNKIKYITSSGEEINNIKFFLSKNSMVYTKSHDFFKESEVIIGGVECEIKDAEIFNNQFFVQILINNNLLWVDQNSLELLSDNKEII